MVWQNFKNVWFGDHFLPSWWTFAQNPWLLFSMVGLRFTNSNTWLDFFFLTISFWAFGSPFCWWVRLSQRTWDHLGLGVPNISPRAHTPPWWFSEKNEPAKMVSLCWGKINILFISTIHTSSNPHFCTCVLPFWLFAPLGGLKFTSWRRPRFWGLPLEVAPHGLTTHIHKPWHNHHDYYP